MLKYIEKTFVLIIIWQIRINEAQNYPLTISDGNIIGTVNFTERQNNTFYAFRGIPFAQPPLEDLRFRDPQPNSPWTGTWDATADPPSCYQFSDFTAFKVSGQEDCLYINVYTPNPNATNLPVLVWIYGGAFIAGTSNYTTYAPDHFLDEGLVVVSFNYRLGVFGFFCTEDTAASGNWGIKDQILALKWVQKNIRSFGGDPNNVTIFGESAGAVSVHLLLQTNKTEGLFHKAIMNSGTTLNLWSLNTRGAVQSRLIATSMLIPSLDTTLMVQKLRKANNATLAYYGWYISWTSFATNGLRGLPWAPCIEPEYDGAVFTKASDDLLNAGGFRKVPILMGMNSQEAVGAGEIAAFIRLYFLSYDVAIGNLCPWSLSGNIITRFQVGAKIQQRYFGLTPIGIDSEKLLWFISDDQFNRPIRRAATDMAKYTNVYFYVFGHQGLLGGNANSTYGGVAHAEDLQYLFKSSNSRNTADVTVSQRMVKLWSNFAKTGNPTPTADPLLQNTIWTPVNSSSSTFNYLSINASLSMQTNPKQTGWEFYTDLFNQYGDKSYTTW